MRLTKLSIDLLHEAVVRAECTGSCICAFVANTEIVNILSNWATSLQLQHSTNRTIWNYPLVILNSIDNNHMIIWCSTKTHLINIEDYNSILKNIINYDPDEKYQYGNKLIDSDVWGLKVTLSYN